jgi:lipoate-protein ligase A
LYLHQCDLGSNDKRVIAKRVCHAAATAISALGIDARFRPQNDIEVDGRKILYSGSVADGDALLYQGTLLVDLDVEKMLQVLRVPVGELSDAIKTSARERFTSLKDLLGHRAEPGLIKRYLTEAFESEFNVEFRESDLTLSEQARYRIALAQIDTRDWVGLVNKPGSDTPSNAARHIFPGGELKADLIYDRPRHRIKQIWFSGDIGMNPRRSIADLEAALHDTSVERLEQNIRVFFAGRRIDMPMLKPDDFIAVTRLAVKQPIVAPSRT